MHAQHMAWHSSMLACVHQWSSHLQKGILEKYGVELIGAKLPSIDRAEDRELFKLAMGRIGLKVSNSSS